MTSVWVPQGVAGSAIPTDPSWWTTDDAPRDLAVEQAGGGLLLTGEGEDADAVLLGLLPIVQWLPGATQTERLTAIDDWEREVLGLASGRPAGSVLLIGLLEVPSGPAEVLALAGGRRWPLPDAADAARRDARTEPVVVPHVDAEAPVGAFARALAAGLHPEVRTAWSTLTAAAADAVASFECGVVVPDRPGGGEPSVEEARALHARARATRDRFVEAGVVLLGCRTALLWPVPVSEGRVAPETAAEVAHEVLRGQLSSPEEWPDGMHRLNELELEVRRMRGEFEERRASGPGLDQLSGRQLVGLLRRKR